MSNQIDSLSADARALAKQLNGVLDELQKLGVTAEIARRDMSDPLNQWDLSRVRLSLTEPRHENELPSR